MYQILLQLRSSLLIFLTHNMALPFLRMVRKEEIFPYSMHALAQMTAGRLGNDLFHFLRQRNLQLLPYYERHDIKHILLQYDTTDEGEVCLQCFMLGNGHISFPVAATVLYGFITMPEYWKKFIVAYRRGKKTVAVKDWQWFQLITEQTISLQQKINNHEQHKTNLI